MAIRIRVYPQPGSIGLRRRQAARIQQQQLQRQQFQLMRQQELLRQQQLQMSFGYGMPSGFSAANYGALGCSTGYSNSSSYSSAFPGYSSFTSYSSPVQQYGYGYATPYSGGSRLSNMLYGLGSSIDGLLGTNLLGTRSYAAYDYGC